MDTPEDFKAAHQALHHPQAAQKRRIERCIRQRIKGTVHSETAGHKQTSTKREGKQEQRPCIDLKAHRAQNKHQDEYQPGRGAKGFALQTNRDKLHDHGTSQQPAKSSIHKPVSHQ